MAIGRPILLAAMFLAGCENRPDEVPDEAFLIDFDGGATWVWCTEGRDGPITDCALFLDYDPDVALHRIGEHGEHWVEQYFDVIDNEAGVTKTRHDCRPGHDPWSRCRIGKP